MTCLLYMLGAALLYILLIIVLLPIIATALLTVGGICLIRFTLLALMGVFS